MLHKLFVFAILFFIASSVFATTLNCDKQGWDFYDILSDPEPGATYEHETSYCADGIRLIPPTFGSDRIEVIYRCMGDECITDISSVEIKWWGIEESAWGDGPELFDHIYSHSYGTFSDARTLGWHTKYVSSDFIHRTVDGGWVAEIGLQDEPGDNTVICEVVLKIYCTVGTIPSTPIGLNSSSITDNSATISWNAVSNATGYYYYYSTTSSTLSIDDGTYTSSTSANLSDLECDTHYYWWVRAVNSCGSSGWSSRRDFYTDDCPAPICNPVGISITIFADAGETECADIGYIENIGTGDLYLYDIDLPAHFTISPSPSYSYPIIIHPGGSQGFTACYSPEDCNDNVSTHTITFTTNCSDASCDFSHVAGKVKIPDSPEHLDEDIIECNSARICWDGVDDITDYYYYYSTHSSEPDIDEGHHKHSSSARICVDITGLSEDEDYYWWVRAVSDGGCTSEWSDSKHFETPECPCPPPDEPENLRTEIDGNEITLRCNAVDDAEHYYFYISRHSSPPGERIRTTHPYLDTILENSTYDWWVQTENECGTSDLVAGETFTISVCPRCEDDRRYDLVLSLTPLNTTVSVDDLPETLSLRYVWRLEYSEHSHEQIAIRNCETCIGNLIIGDEEYCLAADSSEGFNYITIEIPELPVGTHHFDIVNPCPWSDGPFHYLGDFYTFTVNVTGTGSCVLNSITLDDLPSTLCPDVTPELILSWNLDYSGDCSPEYSVYKQIDGGTWNLLVEGWHSDAWTYEVEPSDIGHTLRFKVRVSSEGATSVEDISDNVQITCDCNVTVSWTQQPPPNAEIGDNFDLQWEESHSGSACPIVTPNFILQRQRDGGSWTTIYEDTDDEYEYEVASGDAGANIRFRVKAQLGSYESSFELSNVCHVEPEEDECWESNPFYFNRSYTTDNSDIRCLILDKLKTAYLLFDINDVNFVLDQLSLQPLSPWDAEYTTTFTYDAPPVGTIDLSFYYRSGYTIDEIDESEVEMVTSHELTHRLANGKVGSTLGYNEGLADWGAYLVWHVASVDLPYFEYFIDFLSEPGFETDLLGFDPLSDEYGIGTEWRRGASYEFFQYVLGGDLYMAGTSGLFPSASSERFRNLMTADNNISSVQNKLVEIARTANPSISDYNELVENWKSLYIEEPPHGCRIVSFGFSEYDAERFLYDPSDPSYTGDPYYGHPEWYIIPESEDSIQLNLVVESPDGESSCSFTGSLRMSFGRPEILEDIELIPTFTETFDERTTISLAPIYLDDMLDYGVIYIDLGTTCADKAIVIAKSGKAGSVIADNYNDYRRRGEEEALFDCLISIGSDIIPLSEKLEGLEEGYSLISDGYGVLRETHDGFDLSDLNQIRAFGRLAITGAKIAMETKRTECYIEVGATMEGCMVVAGIPDLVDGTIIGFAAEWGTCVVTVTATCYTYTTASIVLLDASLCAESWLYNVTCEGDYNQCAEDFVNWANDEFDEAFETASNVYHGICNWAASAVNWLEHLGDGKEITDVFRCPVEPWVTYHGDTMFFSGDTLYNHYTPGIMNHHDGVNTILTAVDDSTIYHFTWQDSGLARIRIADNRDTVRHLVVFDVALPTNGQAWYDFGDTIPQLHIDKDNDGVEDTIIFPTSDYFDNFITKVSIVDSCREEYPKSACYLYGGPGFTDEYMYPEDVMAPPPVVGDTTIKVISFLPGHDYIYLSKNSIYADTSYDSGYAEWTINIETGTEYSREVRFESANNNDYYELLRDDSTYFATFVGDTILNLTNGEYILKVAHNPCVLNKVKISIFSGWNLLSSPVSGEQDIRNIISGTAATSPVYSYDTDSGGYYATNIVSPGNGFFLLSFADDTINWCSPSINTINIHLYIGWNLIGFTSDTINALELYTKPFIIYPIYSFDTETHYYTIVDSILIPGKAYWVASMVDTVIMVGE